MAEELYLTPEERIANLSDSLLANIIKGDAESKSKRQQIFGEFKPKVFRDEYYIIYKVLYNFRDKLITPDADFLKMYLLRNEHVILDAKSFIDLNAYSDLDENIVVAYVMAVLKQYTRLLTLPTCSADDFNLLIEKYKLEIQCLKMGESLSQAKNILYDGLDKGKKHYQGYDDAVVYIKSEIADIESLIDTTVGKGFIDASEAGMTDDEDVMPEKIGDFGFIKELNNHLGGIYTPNFYSILAPTKGGKSKFTARLIHNIVVEYGNNAVVWAHEGGYHAWLCQLRAIHYDWFYNRHTDDATQFKTGVSQDTILKNDWNSEEQRNLEMGSRLDLFQNPSYGNIQMIDRPFKVETFIDEIETAVKSNNAKVVLIDYLQLIGWETNGMSKPQAIGQAYQKLLAYAKKRNIAVISPAQFTQEFMNELARSKDGASHEVRTAGGESSEIVRTPDVNIALYASIDDLINNHMKILSVPSRMASPFPAFDIHCDLGVCMFASLPDSSQ